MDRKQAVLDLREPPVTPEAIRELKSVSAAIRLSIHVSGKEDKQIYMALGIDPGHWSRIVNGNSNFPHDRFPDFFKEVRNDVVVEYLAYQCGKGVHRLESELEKENRELREEMARMQRDREIEIKLLKELGGRG